MYHNVGGGGILVQGGKRILYTQIAAKGVSHSRDAGELNVNALTFKSQNLILQRVDNQTVECRTGVGNGPRHPQDLYMKEGIQSNASMEGQLWLGE